MRLISSFASHLDEVQCANAYSYPLTVCGGDQWNRLNNKSPTKTPDKWKRTEINHETILESVKVIAECARRVFDESQFVIVCHRHQPNSFFIEIGIGTSDRNEFSVFSVHAPIVFERMKNETKETISVATSMVSTPHSRLGTTWISIKLYSFPNQPSEAPALRVFSITVNAFAYL